MSQKLENWKRECQEMKKHLEMTERVMDGNRLDVQRDVSEGFAQLYSTVQSIEKGVIETIEKHYSKIAETQLQLNSELQSFSSLLSPSEVETKRESL